MPSAAQYRHSRIALLTLALLSLPGAAGRTRAQSVESPLPVQATEPGNGQFNAPDAQINAGPSLSLSKPENKLGAGRARLQRPEGDAPKRQDPLALLTTLGTSLAVVLGLFFVAAWAMRKSIPRGMRPLPTEVFESLGRTTLPGRQHMQLVRCGRKLLLLWTGSGAVETLTEIDDPDEVSRLLSLCRREQPGSSAAEFRQVFAHLERGAAGAELTHTAPERTGLAGAFTGCSGGGRHV